MKKKCEVYVGTNNLNDVKVTAPSTKGDVDHA